MLFELNREKIYPWVKAVFTDDGGDDANDLELHADNEPIFKIWIDDLAIFYVADMGNDFQVLQRRHLPTSLSVEQLDELAADNLRRDIEFKLNPTNFGGYGLLAGGDHEAGAICLPEKWEWLADYFGDNLIVAIPSKDLVLMAPSASEDIVSSMKIFVHRIFQEGERLLTRNIFMYVKETQTWTIVDRIQADVIK